MFKRILLLFTMLLLLLPVASAQDELEEQRFLLTFIPNIQFSPVYVAQAKGYVAEAGYELTVEYLNEPDVIDLIAAGQANFGIVSGEQVILAVSQERPVIFIYEWFQQYPVGIVVDADSDIESATDLTDKKVGLPGRFGATYSGLTTLLLASGMTETDVALEEIGFNAPDVFCLGALDASVIYTNNEPLQIRNRAQQGDCGDINDVRVISIAEITDLVANGLITSQDVAENDPEQVQAMVNAFDMALNDIINNPAEAYLLSIDYVENLPLSDEFRAALETLSEEQNTFLADEPDMDAIVASRVAMLETLREDFSADELIQFEVLLASIDLWSAEQIGFTDATSWEIMQDTLIEMGFLEDVIDLESVYTNIYLPE